MKVPLQDAMSFVAFACIGARKKHISFSESAADDAGKKMCVDGLVKT